MKSRGLLKVCVTLIGIIIFIFGFVFFVGSAFESVDTPTFKISNQFLPISQSTEYDIDSDYNIYVAVEEASTIQVYNSKGMFMKSYSFNTGGGGVFDFFIDNNDILRILVHRGEYELEIIDDVANLVSVEDLNSRTNMFREYISFFREERGLKLHKGNFSYVGNNEELVNVSLERAPFYLSLFQQFLLMLMGGILVYFPNRRVFVSRNKEI
jgi:hypothetical protein